MEATATGAEARIRVRSDDDVVAARSAGRDVARCIGFDGADLVVITTAISEIARNIVQHADEGEITIAEARQGEQRRGIEVAARDQGPGIEDVDLAMRDGYSTRGGLGLGLPGARRMMDEFEITSEVGHGTSVVMRKWRLPEG